MYAYKRTRMNLFIYLFAKEPSAENFCFRAGDHLSISYYRELQILILSSPSSLHAMLIPAEIFVMHYQESKPGQVSNRIR